MKTNVGGLTNKQKSIFYVCILCTLAFVLVLLSIPSGKTQTDKADNSYIYGFLDGKEDDGQNVLFLGRDFDSSRTDVVAVVSFDFDSGSVRAIQIPRDSYVEDGGYAGRLANLLPRYKTEAEQAGSKDALADGIARLMKKLQSDLGLKIDRYVFMESTAVELITDAVGGVELEVPADIDYTDAERAINLHLKEGKQTLDGKTAAMFIRYRQGYPQADIGRLDAQKMYVAALCERLFSYSSVANAETLIKSLASCVKTDLTADEIARLSVTVLSADAKKVILHTAPGNGVTVKGASYYGLYTESLNDITEQCFGYIGKGAAVGFPEAADGYTDTAGERLSSIIEHGLSIPVYAN